MIRIENLSVFKDSQAIVRNASFSVREGKISVVLGKNGAGKSTLLEALTLPGSNYTGHVNWDGREKSEVSGHELAKRRAVLAQKVQTAFSFRVRDLVEMGTYAGRPNPQLVPQALAAVEMESFSDRNFNSLSGGEQKRVMLAKCLVQLYTNDAIKTPKYLFLDEPTANLDLRQQLLLMARIKELARKRNIGVFAVLHDLNLAAQFADEILLMRAGKIVALGNPWEALTPENLQAVFDVTIHIQPHPVLDCPYITVLQDQKDLSPAGKPINFVI